MPRKRRSNGQGTLFKRKDGGPWIASWYDHTGKRKERSARTTDRRAAEQIPAKYVADSALRRHRVVDPKHDRYQEAEARPLEEHIDDFAAICFYFPTILNCCRSTSPCAVTNRIVWCLVRCRFFSNRRVHFKILKQ